MIIKPLWQIEREAIELALDLYDVNRTHAAAALDISIRNIRNKIRLYKTTPPFSKPLPQKLWRIK